MDESGTSSYLDPMEFSQFYCSPRFRAQYLEAVETLSAKLNETWERVFPSDARWPMETCQTFFEPFVQFGVALYDACAQKLLAPLPSHDQYAHSLNFDLKTFVCDRIYPYREKPIRTLQDALDADKRGEWPGEWATRMREAWQQFEHPRHEANHDRVRREFIDLYGLQPVWWEQLIERVHKGISKRVVHWSAAHAELIAAAAEDATSLETKTENSNSALGLAQSATAQTTFGGNRAQGRPSWQEVRSQFLRGAVECSDLAADWDSRQGLWTFSSTKPGEVWKPADPEAEHLFKETARVAVNLLGKSGEPVPSFHVWLEVMRTEKRGFQRILKPRTWSETRRILEAEMPIHPADVSLNEDGNIPCVFKESADFCEDLAARPHDAARGIENPAGPPEGPPPGISKGGDCLPRDQAPAEESVRVSVLDTARIRKWMADEGYVNEVLADRLHISQRAVSSILNNRKYHGRKAVTKLANLMGHSVEELFLP